MTVRNLVLIRHAKSSWDNAKLKDHERPLAERGEAACKVMGMNNLSLLSEIEQCYCSTALRAMQTIEQLNKSAKITSMPIDYNDRLYTFDWQGLLSSISYFSDDYSTVAIVGHNPAMTDFVNEFSDKKVSNMSTCAIAELAFSISSWRNIEEAEAKLVYFDRPKNYR